MKRQEIIEFVKRYALDHYNDGGWDVIVECYDDEDIARVIGDVRTTDEALKKIGAIVDVFADRQAEARQYATEIEYPKSETPKYQHDDEGDLPSWKGITIESENYCDHEQSPNGYCWYVGCKHSEHNIPF